VLIDHSTSDDMVACDYILDAAFEHSGQRLISCARSLGRVCDHALPWTGDQESNFEGGTYDEGVAHAEVPTSSVRVCWW